MSIFENLVSREPIDRGWSAEGFYRRGVEDAAPYDL